jgi:CheY-like chemotaxis protein/HPt (histidine-containing phosphotransfer) domain-containing protein
MLGIGANRELPTILIIDDDMVSREVMATVLTMTGYTIHTAALGGDAVALLDAGACRPEVILMDAQMPGLNGTGLVKELRARSQASIYAMSGSDVAEDLKNVVDGHLSKPFSPETLRQLIEKHHAPAAAPAEDDAPIINQETLAQLRAVMSDAAVREIYVAVIDDLDKRGAALERSLAAGDTREIKRIGHTIKGGASMAGAMQASRIGAQLESGGDQLDNVPPLLEHLKAAARNLRRMLESDFSVQG